jgi:hypothetical protein
VGLHALGDGRARRAFPAADDPAVETASGASGNPERPPVWQGWRRTVFFSFPVSRRADSLSLIDLPMRAGLWRSVRPAGGPSIRNLVKTDHKMTPKLLPGILAMAIIVVASNILVQHLFGQWLTWGAFTIPLPFLSPT